MSIALESIGDRWSLLIVRDLMVRGKRTFKEFLESGEGIASNILTDRLQSLERAGIVAGEPEASDLRKINYRLTEKGIDLAPVILELLLWSAQHEKTGVPPALMRQMKQQKQELLGEVRRRWAARDLTPLLPKFGRGKSGAGGFQKGVKG